MSTEKKSTAKVHSGRGLLGWLRFSVVIGPKERPSQVIIRPVPKIVFLYPTAFLAILFSIFTFFGMDMAVNYGLNLLFMFIFSLNLLVFAFEFSVMMTIVLLVILVFSTIIILLVNFYTAGQNIFTEIFGFIRDLQIGLNNQFYYYFFFLSLLIFILIFLRTRFNYWTFDQNQVLHYQGLLHDVRRYYSPSLTFKREISDVLEYIMLGGGVLKLMPHNQEPQVIETVTRVNKIEKAIAKILAELEVDIHKEPSASAPDV
jgi:hypothetical protein